MTEQEREELIEKMAQGILRAIAKRNCIIAGAPYNENNVDEFDICEALDHARAALAVAEPVIRDECARMAEKRACMIDCCEATGVKIAAAIREGGEDD